MRVASQYHTLKLTSSELVRRYQIIYGSDPKRAMLLRAFLKEPSNKIVTTDVWGVPDITMGPLHGWMVLPSILKKICPILI